VPNPTWIGGLHHALSHPNSWKSIPGSLKNCNCPKFHQEIPFFAPWQRGFNFGWSLEGIRFGHFKESDFVTSRNQILSLQGIRFCHFKESDFVTSRNQILSNGRNQIWSFKESDLVIQGIRFGHSKNQIWSIGRNQILLKKSQKTYFSRRRLLHSGATSGGRTPLKTRAQVENLVSTDTPEGGEDRRARA
jgi:hypothetical protein